MQSGNNRKTEGDLFKVHMAQLKNGPVELSRDIPLSRIKERLTYCEYAAVPESATINIKVEPCGNGALVRGKVEATVKTECGMCLADTVLHLNPAVSAYIAPKAEAQEELEEQELTPEDLEREWFSGDEIILDELVLDTLMLEMPMNPKCGSSCSGPIQAGSLEPKPTIDPRLAPLAKLKIEKE